MRRLLTALLAFAGGLLLGGAHHQAIRSPSKPVAYSYDADPDTSGSNSMTGVGKGLARALAKALFTTSAVIPRPLQAVFVAADTAATATGVEGVTPSVIRTGDLKLLGVPDGAAEVVTDNGKGLAYSIPRVRPSWIRV